MLQHSRTPSILPPMNDQEMLETTKIYSAISTTGNLSRLVADILQNTGCHD
jgi:predicted ATPase with chaperone activity